MKPGSSSRAREHKRAAAARLPAGLALCLTEASNLLRCGRSRALSSPARSLSFSEASAGIDAYAALAPGGTVTFTGGEPLLEVELLCGLIKYARKNWPRLGMDIETNGTLLTPARADRLASLGADLWVKFSGAREIADRLGLRGDGASVFDVVVKNLDSLSPAQRRRICAAAEFSARDLGLLPEAMAFLRRYGFKEMTADLAVYEAWPEAKLPLLRRALRGVCMSYARELKAGGCGWPQPSRLYGLSFDDRLGAAAAYPAAAAMALSGDGWFYPCALEDPEAARGLRCGNIRDGLDLRKLDGLYDGLFAYLKKRGYTDAFLPPAERYFSALAAGRDPAAALAGGAAAAAVFKEELGPLMRVEKSLAELARKKSFNGLGTSREFLGRLAALALAESGFQPGALAGGQLFQDIKAGKIKGGAGGKAAALERLSALGFSVPPTFVLSVETVNKLFGPRPAGAHGLSFGSRPPAEFFSELSGLFPAKTPFIVRSSSAEEDGADASFAGLFDSVVVRDPALAAEAAMRCLRSGRGPAANAYRRLTGKGAPPVPAMALVFQPFLKAEFGGVALLEGRGRATIELSPGGNSGITGGKAAGFRYTLQNTGGKLSGPVGGPLSGEGARRLFSRIAAAAKKLFPGRGAAVEFLLKGGEPVFLQARPAPAAGSRETVDMAGIYFRIKRAMDGLGAGPADWSLAENSDAAAFNYLGAARPSGERLEHFRIRLTTAARQRIASKGWISVKYDQDDDTIFPSELAGRAAAALGGLAKAGIFVIFVLPRPGERPPRKSLDFRHKGKKFRLSFSYDFEPIEGEEALSLSRLPAGEAAAYLGRLAREREIWLGVKEKLAGARGAYEKQLAEHIPRELALIAKKIRLASAVAALKGRPGQEIKGIPFRPSDRLITGPAVTFRQVARTRKKRFIYFGHDLEPCFLPYLGRIAAVVVSRGAFGSHAAQICGELGVPLVIETSGLERVKDGDAVAVDMRTGAVTLERRVRP